MGIEITHMARDKSLEEQGRKIELGSGGAIWVRPAFYRPYQEAIRRIQRENGIAIQNGMFDDEAANDLVGEAVARHLVTGWEGIEMNGEPLACTPENAERVFELAPDFLDMVVRAANDHAAYRRRDIQRDGDALGKG